MLEALYFSVMVTMKKGVLVKVLYPPYAAGLIAIVKAQEDDPKRWIVQVIQKDNSPFLLSLEKEEFDLL